MKNLNQYMLESLKISDDYRTKSQEQLPKNCCGYFYNTEEVNVDKVENFDTSNVTDMNQMFCNATFDSDSLDLNTWDVSNVTNMSRMFQDCNDITAMYLANWNTYNTINTKCMFYMCENLKYLDLSNWDMSNLKNAACMFQSCKSLKTINSISNWDMSNVKDISNMFFGCESLESLDLSSWNIKYNTTTASMFGECYNLTNIKFGPGWGKLNSNFFIEFSIIDCGKNKGYKLSDETWESMLTMYDRRKGKKSNLPIYINKKHNIPDGWIDKMEARGYEIKTN